jgi:hypothetical protein
VSNYSATSDNHLIPGILSDAGYPTFPVPSALDQVNTWKAASAGKSASKELFVVLIGGNDGINAAVNDLNPNAPQVNAALLAGAVTQRIGWIVGNITAAGVKSRVSLIVDNGRH